MPCWICLKFGLFSFKKPIIKKQHNTLEFRQAGHVLLTHSTRQSNVCCLTIVDTCLFNSKLLVYGSGFIIFIIPPITTWSGSLQFEASCLWLWVHHLHHSTHHHLVRVSSIRSFLSMALGSSSSSFHPSPPGPGLFNSKLLAYGSGFIIFIIPPITTWSVSLQFEASCLWLWVHHLHHSTHHHLVRVDFVELGLALNQTHF